MDININSKNEETYYSNPRHRMATKDQCRNSMEENQTNSEDKKIEIIFSSGNQCEFQKCLEKIILEHINRS
jgi:hypothetical protein